MAAFALLRNEPDVRAVKAGEVIFAEGQPGDVMYTVVDGAVEIRRGERVLDVVAEGGVFGEMALIDHEPRSASAVATRAGRVAVITEKRFTQLVQQTPFFALQMMQLLAERVRRNLAS